MSPTNDYAFDVVPHEPSDSPYPTPPPLAPGAMMPAPVSGLATAALITTVVGVLCVGPAGSLAAVILGALALWDIKQSGGRKSGTGQALASLAIGVFVTLCWGALIAFAMVGATRKTPRSSPVSTYSPPPTAIPTTPAPRTTPTPTASMSKDTTTRETRLGSLVIVDVGSDVSSLDGEFRAQRAKASKAGEKMFVQTSSTTCRPCLGLAASMADARMQKGLAGVRLVRVDVHEFAADLTALQIPAEVIPGFYTLGPDLTPIDGITGAEWDDDTAENIAPVVSAYVRGKYAHRREPWKGPRAPRPDGIAL